MRFLFGFLTFSAMAAGATLWMAPGPDAELAVVTDVGKGGVATLSMPTAAHDKQATGDVPAQPRFFGFALTEAAASAGHASHSPVPAVEIAAARQIDVAATSFPVAAATSTPVATAPVPPARGSWSNDVVVYAETQASAVASPARPSANAAQAPARVAPQPPRDKPRAELVRDIQRELRRVGCYAGDVNGEWGIGAKRSLRAFMDQIGSRVQSDEPDLIQLTLVRGFSGVACRPANGQMMANKQPAQPALVPVQVAAPSAPASAASQMAAVPVEQPQFPASRAMPLDGRMAIGGPLPEGAGETPPAPQAAPPPKPRPAPQRQRQERAWLNNFFNN